jgi:hypothetical protein
MTANRHEIKERATEEYKALLQKHGVTGKRMKDMIQAFEDGVATGLEKQRKATDWAYANGFEASK